MRKIAIAGPFADKYEDTDKDAIRLLAEMSNVPKAQLAKAQAGPLQARGAWLVTLPSGQRFRVFTKPHPEAGDFEELDA